MLLLACGLICGWLANDRYHQPPAIERLTGLPEGYRPVALTRQVDPDKLVLHVDSSDWAVFDRAMKLAESLLAHNPRHEMWRSSCTAADWTCCGRTSRLTATASTGSPSSMPTSPSSHAATPSPLTRGKGKTVVLVPEAKVVSPAVGEIVARMQQGWVYIKV